MTALGNFTANNTNTSGQSPDNTRQHYPVRYFECGSSVNPNTPSPFPSHSTQPHTYQSLSLSQEALPRSHRGHPPGSRRPPAWQTNTPSSTKSPVSQQPTSSPSLILPSPYSSDNRRQSLTNSTKNSPSTPKF